MEEKVKVEELEKDMTPVLLEDLGMRFATEKSKQKSRYGLYQCQYCGKGFEAQPYNIKTGNTKSCGCQAKANRKTHGLLYHSLYSIWVQMLHRCNNPKNKRYKDYGGRGIKVCDRWLDINNFIEDMYPTYEKGLSIDRVDGSGNYEPDNCRWTTSIIQARNTKDIRTNNTSGFRGVSYDKKNNNWASYINVNKKRIHLGSYPTALEAAKAYETYVRLNNLEHNFTPALTEEEIEEINKQKENK